MDLILIPKPHHTVNVLKHGQSLNLIEQIDSSFFL